MNLCLELKRDFQPIVVAFKGGALAEKLRASGVRVHVLNRRSGIDVSLSFSLVKLMKRYQVRVVNTHHFVSLFYAFWASKVAGVPLVHTEHSRWEMERLSTFWRFWFKFFLQRLEMTTAVSKGAFDYLREDLSTSPERTTLIRNGIDIELFRKGVEQTIPRQELGLDENDLVVGVVGNLRSEKNQELLIRTLALLQGQKEHFKALLIGDGPCRSFLKQLAQQLGVADRVLFLGVRHDVPRLYGVMDIYCLPSRYEGLPLTLLEAMAAGIPIVGTDVLGIKEMINHNQNGLLVADNDPEALKVALLSLADRSDLRSELAERAQSTVVAEYSFEKFVFGYKSIFAQLGKIDQIADN